MRLSWPRTYQLLLGRRLRSGPFSGMKYITACVGSALWPKMLGTYELELAPAVDEIVESQPDVIINAGAAEGYYAVGLALRCAKTPVIAYERDPEGRKLLRLLADANAVRNRVAINAECSAGSLEADLRGFTRPAIIMDVEGAELEILDPDRCPSLRKTAMLVELHFHNGESTGRRLEERFGPTHHIARIDSTTRSFEQLPWAMRLIGSLGWRSSVTGTLDEGRGPGMSWLWMRPRLKPAA